MEDIVVIDNIFPNKLSDIIEQLITNKSCKYTIDPFTIINHSDNNQSEYFDGLQLVNLFMENGQFTTKGVSHFFLLPLQLACLQRNLLFSLNKILRAKVNVKLRQNSNKNTLINPPHKDNINYPHLIGIYYVNDSDGDTIIYDSNDEPIKNISPKKGRFLFMNGNRLHSASHPTKTDKRMVINYNLMI